MKRATCEGCKFWSEMVASAEGGGPIRAYCLHESMAGKSYYTRMTCDGCEHYEAGVAIDHPALRAEAER